MIKPARHFAGQKKAPTLVTWRVGPVTQPDSLRTGRLVRVEGERALVHPTEELSPSWMLVADLQGVPVQPDGLRLVKPKPVLGHALDLPAPVAESLELLGLLDHGVEVQAGQHTKLMPVLRELESKGYIVERRAGSGVWDLTPKGREVIDA